MSKIDLDIVEQLHAWDDYPIGLITQESPSHLIEMLHEAANEIVSLRKKAKLYDSACRYHDQQNKAITALTYTIQSALEQWKDFNEG